MIWKMERALLSNAFKYDNKMCLVCKTWFCLDLASASPGYFALTSLWKLLQRASCIHTTNNGEVSCSKFSAKKQIAVAPGFLRASLFLNWIWCWGRSNTRIWGDIGRSNQNCRVGKYCTWETHLTDWQEHAQLVPQMVFHASSLSDPVSNISVPHQSHFTKP